MEAVVEELWDVTREGPPSADQLSLGLAAAKKERKLRIQHPLDAIFTLAFSEHTLMLAFAALEAGLLLGIQSPALLGSEKANPLRKVPWYKNLPYAFVDCDWHDYDHAVHLEAVAAVRPKYATVRDYLTVEQAQRAGIAYFSLDRILRWAEELAQYAERVIIIPKADVIEAIPPQYVLGYSVPTRYGGTPLPIEIFAERQVHLLGGSWLAQRQFLDQLGDAVVSIDFNYLYLVARYGGIVFADGAKGSLPDFLPGKVINPITVSSVLSLGFVSQALTDEYAPLSTNTSGREGIRRAHFKEVADDD